MTRHGISHGAALFTCTFTSGALIRMASDSSPALLTLLDECGKYLTDTFNLALSGRAIAELLLACGLATLWGAVFSLMHSDR